MNNILILIQIIVYQKIRIVVNLGADQAVRAGGLQVCNGPEIFFVDIINVQGVLI